MPGNAGGLTSEGRGGWKRGGGLGGDGVRESKVGAVVKVKIEGRTG